MLDLQFLYSNLCAYIYPILIELFKVMVILSLTVDMATVTLAKQLSDRQDSSSKTGVPIAPGALRESGLCALGAMSWSSVASQLP